MSLGLGVMIKMLGGNEDSAKAFTESIGKEIKTVGIIKDDLMFEFTDGSKLAISDEGQSCCEHRYIMTDDDLTYFTGAKLISAEVKDAPNITDDDGDVHEVAFLEVTTDKGSFQCATHNEHNGYYGGFCIRARAWGAK